MRPLSPTALTREPSWSIHTVGTSTMRWPRLGGRGQQVDVEQQVARAQARQDVARPRRGAGPSRRTACRGRAGRAGAGRAKREAGAGQPPRERAGAPAAPPPGWRRVAIAPSACSAASARRMQLLRRRRAVGVDEAHEVGVGAPEGLGDHPALAELRVLEQLDAVVVVRVGLHDLRRAVAAVVHRDEEPVSGSGQRVAVRAERAADPVLLVVRGHDDVQAQAVLPSRGRSWGQGFIRRPARRSRELRKWRSALDYGPAEGGIRGRLPILTNTKHERARPHTTIAAMSDVTVAEEEYLQTLYWLFEAQLPMTGANVARAMQLSAPTVHEMVGRLERDGHITRAPDKAISSPTPGASTRRRSSVATG